MHVQVELNTISVTKSDPTNKSFQKYDIEAALNEIENMEDRSIFRYAFTILSNPKNIRFVSEGIAHIYGTISEREELLEKDESDIPKILTMIYRELFPTFFLLSKTSSIPCPPYDMQILGMSSLSDSVDESKEGLEFLKKETVEGTEMTDLKTESQIGTQTDSVEAEKPIEPPLINEQAQKTGV